MGLKRTVEELDAGQFEAMWNMLRFGYQEVPHIGTLKEYCDALRQAMIQKSDGARKDSPKHYVSLKDTGMLINSIAIEAMCLYLSGALDKLEEIYDEEII